MSKLHPNFYLRKCYLENDPSTPSQSVIIQKQGRSLANVYFQTMPDEIKVYAGLIPVLKGATNVTGNLFLHPAEILASQNRLVPIKSAHYQMISSEGVEYFGETLVTNRINLLQERIKKELREYDLWWRKNLSSLLEQVKEKFFFEELERHNEILTKMKSDFNRIYPSQIAQIEGSFKNTVGLLLTSLREEINVTMNNKYLELLEDQTSQISYHFQQKMVKERNKLATQFLFEIESSRKTAAEKIKEINLEKINVLEHMKKHLHSINTAIYLYIALAEKKNHLEICHNIQRDQEFVLEGIKKEIAIEEKEIQRLQIEKENIKEYDEIWEQKVLKMMNNFKKCISYCINNLPEQKDFFIKLESLMVLQMSTYLNERKIDKVFDVKCKPCCDVGSQKNTTINPFIAFGDINKKDIDEHQCNHFFDEIDVPVFVFGKNFIYVGCENYDRHYEDIQKLFRSDELEIKMNHFCDDLGHTTKINKKDFDRYFDIKVEDSLLTIIDSEINDRNQNLQNLRKSLSKKQSQNLKPSKKETQSIGLYMNVSNELYLSRKEIGIGVMSSRISKIESARLCPFIAKKMLNAHLPPYMISKSSYKYNEQLYSKCGKESLEKLLCKSNKFVSYISSAPLFRKTSEIGVQCTDVCYEILCECIEMKGIEDKINSKFCP